MCASFFGGQLTGAPRFRLIINVDPLGPGTAREVIDIAEGYSDQVVYRCPQQASFSAAINWCFDQLKSELAFHIEDDWLLLEPVEFASLAAELTGNVAQIRLPYRHPLSAPGPYSFRPNLFKVDSVKSALSVPPQEDPEKWFAKSLPADCGKDFGGRALVEDMGRKWAKGQGIRKVGGADWFTARPAGLLAAVDWKIAMYRYRRIAKRWSAKCEY